MHVDKIIEQSNFRSHFLFYIVLKKSLLFGDKLLHLPFLSYQAFQS